MGISVIWEIMVHLTVKIDFDHQNWQSWPWKRAFHHETCSIQPWMIDVMWKVGTKTEARIDGRNTLWVASSDRCLIAVVNSNNGWYQFTNTKAGVYQFTTTIMYKYIYIYTHTYCMYIHMCICVYIYIYYTLSIVFSLQYYWYIYIYTYIHMRNS